MFLVVFCFLVGLAVVAERLHAFEPENLPKNLLRPFRYRPYAVLTLGEVESEWEIGLSDYALVLASAIAWARERGLDLVEKGADGERTFRADRPHGVDTIEVSAAEERVKALGVEVERAASLTLKWTAPGRWFFSSSVERVIRLDRQELSSELYRNDEQVNRVAVPVDAIVAVVPKRVDAEARYVVPGVHVLTVTEQVRLTRGRLPELEGAVRDLILAELAEL